MRRVLTAAMLAALALSGVSGTGAHAVCGGVLACAVTGCHGTVNVCAGPTACSGTVSVCPLSSPGQCTSTVDVCAGPIYIAHTCEEPTICDLLDVIGEGGS
jgi:hypothetical protein